MPKTIYVTPSTKSSHDLKYPLFIAHYPKQWFSVTHCLWHFKKQKWIIYSVLSATVIRGKPRRSRWPLYRASLGSILLYVIYLWALLAPVDQQHNMLVSRGAMGCPGVILKLTTRVPLCSVLMVDFKWWWYYLRWEDQEIYI